jgi:hypothetical protein
MFASSNNHRSVTLTSVFRNLQKDEIMQNDLNQSDNSRRIETIRTEANSSLDELKKNSDASKMLMPNLNERLEKAKRQLQDRLKLQKLSHKFIESFRIVETMNKQAYRLILFSSYRIHDVFHVFYLKSYKRREDDSIISEYLSSELLDDDEVNEVEEILQKKISKKIIYYLIK